jgi:hypothetical protein
MFLRHDCPQNLINKSGWVHIGTMSFYLKISRVDIRNAIKDYLQHSQSPEQIEENQDLLRSLSFHSIPKIRQELIHPKYDVKMQKFGYFNLCDKNRASYVKYGDLYPPKRRVYTSLYLDNSHTANDYAQVVVNIESLAHYYDLHYVKYTNSVVIRGPVRREHIVDYIEFKK